MDEQHQTLRIGSIAPLEDLDPRTVVETLSETACRQVFETPYQIKNRQGHVKPWLFATPLARVSGGADNEVQAIVRPDVVFSDGTPMTAEMVVACLRQEPLFRDLTIRAKGERIRFQGAATMREIELALCSTRAAVWRSAAKGLIGTGPLQVVHATAGASCSDEGDGSRGVELTPNPYYPRTHGLNRISFTVFTLDAEGRPTDLIAAMQDGRIDLTFDLTQGDAEILTACTVKSSPGLSTALLFFNTARPPFDQGRLRLAVAKMLDRSQLARLLFDKPFTFVATSLLPPELGRYWDRLGRDQEEASDFAASCRQPERPLELLLVSGPRPYLPNPALAAEWIGEQLAPLGLRVVVKESVSPEDFDWQAASGNYDLVLAGRMLESLEAYRYLESILSSQSVPSPEAAHSPHFNFARLESTEMDAALERYRVTGSDQALADVLALGSSLMPALPLLHGADVVVHSPRVQGVSIGPGGLAMLSEVRLASPATPPIPANRRAVS